MGSPKDWVITDEVYRTLIPILAHGVNSVSGLGLSYEFYTNLIFYEMGLKRAMKLTCM